MWVKIVVGVILVLAAFAIFVAMRSGDAVSSAPSPGTEFEKGRR